MASGGWAAIAAAPPTAPIVPPPQQQAPPPQQQQAPRPTPPSLNDASTQTFVRAVHVVFGEWTCLKLAVENEWAGHQTRDRALALLKRVLDGLLSSANVHRDELEDVLDTALVDEFNLEAEDESPQQVANLLLTLHAEAKVGATTMADSLLARAATKGPSWVQVPPPPKAKEESSDEEDLGSDDEGMEDDDDGTTPRGAGAGSSSSTGGGAAGAGGSAGVQQQQQGGGGGGGGGGGVSSMDAEDISDPSAAASSARVPAAPEVDDDGFQMVPTRKARSSRRG